MSTEYYLFKEPITYVRAEKQGVHTHVSIFVNHAYAGELVFREEEADSFLHMLVNVDDPLLRRSCAKEGMVTHWNHDSRGFQRDQQVVSEHGELTTLGKIGTNDLFG